MMILANPNSIIDKVKNSFMRVDRFHIIIGFLVILMISFIYFSFPSKWYLYDGVRWSFFIEKDEIERIIRLKHFFSSVFGFVSYRIAILFGYQGRALPLLQVLNTFWGIFGLMIFNSLIYSVTKDKIISVVSSLSLGFSYVYWFCSISPEMDIHTYFFLIIAFSIAIKFINDNSFKSRLLFGIIFVFILLVDAGSILLYPTMMLAIYFHSQTFSINVKNLFKVSLTYFGLALSLFLVLVIVLNMVYSDKSLWHGSFLIYFDKDLWWHSFSFDNFIKSLYGMFRGFIGGYFIKEFLIFKQSFPFYIYFVLIGILMVLCGGLSYLSLINKKRIWNNYKIPLSLCLVYFLCCAVFFIFYAPGYYRLWGRVLIPFWLVFGIFISDIIKNINKKFQAYVLSVSFLVPVLLFSINFFGSILPQSYENNNENLQLTFFIKENTNKNDLIFFSGQGSMSDGILVRYFAGNRTISIREELHDQKKVSSLINRFLKTDDKIYYITEVKQASTESIFKLIGLSGKDISINNKIQDFFSNYGYKLNMVNQYESKNYESVIYRVSLKDK